MIRFVVNRVVATLVVAAATLIACSPETPQPSSVAVVPTPGGSGEPAASGPVATFEVLESAPPIPFPGLYVTPYLGFSGDDVSVVLRSAGSCRTLASIIEAGEWRVVDRITTPTDAANPSPALTILSLERDDETALAWLAGGDTCAARIVRTSRGTLSLSGAAAFDGAAPYDEFICVTTDRNVVFGVTYRPPSGPAVQIGMVVPARLGTSDLDVGDVSVHVARGTVSISELASTLIEAFNDSDGGFFPEEYQPAERAEATIDVTSISPFQGTVRISGYEGERGAIEVEATVSCHLPGGTLARVAEAAAAPVPTAAPVTPGPTLGTVTGAPPNTVVAAGGPVAGSYGMAPSELICFRDDDLGAWSLTTSMARDTTFFLSAIVPAGGGETDQVSLGLIVGDGSNNRIAQVDTTIQPPMGAAHGSVSVAGGTVTWVIEGRTPDGVTVAVNLTCSP